MSVSISFSLSRGLRHWAAVGDGDVPSLLADPGQDLGDLLLAVDHLGQEADAVDLAVVVPARLDQDDGIVLGRDGQAVHRAGERLAIVPTVFFGYVIEMVATVI